MATTKRQPAVFGERLRALRTAAGLTQADVGARAGMIAQAVSRLESGAVQPTWPTVLDLAAALGVTPDAFLRPRGKVAR